MITNLEFEKIATIVPKRFSVEEFRKMTEAGILPEESGWEVIDGYLIDKMTIGSRHAGVVKRLNRLFAGLVGEWAIVSVQDPVQIDDYNAPEPDIAILAPRDDFYAEKHPRPDDVLLLIEVSDSTLELDREVKKSLYAAAGIKEFWIVNLKENTIECYSSPKNGAYRLARILESGERIEAQTIDNLSFQVEEILGL